jgi:uncharacterized protein (TIGR02246 family)
MTDRHEEEHAIIDVMQAFADAWNRGAARAISSFFAEDATRVGAFGDVQHGRPAIEAALDRLLTQTMSGASVRQERGTVRVLTPDLAVWQAPIEIVRGVSAAPLKGHVVQVMKKVGERWLILEAHPKFFPPPAG